MNLGVLVFVSVFNVYVSVFLRFGVSCLVVMSLKNVG